MAINEKRLILQISRLIKKQSQPVQTTFSELSGQPESERITPLSLQVTLPPMPGQRQGTDRTR
jgi:hypothetical protein